MHLQQKDYWGQKAYTWKEEVSQSCLLNICTVGAPSSKG